MVQFVMEVLTMVVLSGAHERFVDQHLTNTIILIDCKLERNIQKIIIIYNYYDTTRM